MTTRRDIELLISARDQTGRTLPELVRNVAALSEKLGEQAIAAERGEVKLADLERTQRDLAAAGRELVQQQSLVDSFERQSKATADAEAKAAALVAEYRALKAELGQTGTATAAQERKLASLETKSIAATAAVTAQKTALTGIVESMTRAGLAVDNLDRQQTELVASARSVGTSLSAVGGILDGYEEHVRQLAAAERAAQDTELGARKVADAQKLRQATDYVDFWTQALRDAEIAEQRLSTLNNFRRVGQDALEASRDLSQFVQVGQTFPAATSDLARGLRAIVEPGRAAIQTLDGLENEITQAGAVASAEKRRVSEYSDALNRLSQAQAEIIRQGGMVDSFRNQSAVVEAARAKFDQAGAEVRQYAAAVSSADTPNEELARSLDHAQRELEQTGRALGQEEAKLASLERELRRAKIDTNNLATAQDRLENTARQAAAASAQLNTTLGRNGGRPGGLFGLNPYEIQNLGFQINDVITGLISGQRPFQVLAQQGGQIAQIFPGAATAVLRFALAWSPVIAAIGAVILLFRELAQDTDRVRELSVALGVRVDGGLYDPHTLSRIEEGLQLVGVAADDARKVITEFIEAGVRPEDLDAFTQSARNMADVMQIDITDAAEQMTSILRGNYESISELDVVTNTLTDSEMEHVRVMFESGRAAEARQFVFDRVRDKMDQFAAQARGPWKTAIDSVRGAWDGFMSRLSQTAPFEVARQHMSRFARGLVVLTGLLNGQSWAEAQQNAAGIAFDQQWAENMAAISRMGANDRTALGQTRAQALADAQGIPMSQRTPEQGGRATAQNRQAEERNAFERDYLQQQGEELTNIQRLSRADRIRLVGLRAMREAQGATRGGVTLSDEAVQQARLNAERAEGIKIDEEESRRAQQSQRQAEAAARRAESQRRAEENRIRGIQNSLRSQLRQIAQRAGRGENASLESRLEAINVQYERIFDTIQQLQDAGVTETLDGSSLEAARATVEANKQILRQEETLAYWEDQTNSLISHRRTLVDQVSDSQKAGATEVLAAFAQAEQINARISPQIVQAAQRALEMARQIARFGGNPELLALIDRLERLVASEQRPNALLTPQASVGLEGFRQQERDLNEIISSRNALVESYNTLVTLGTMDQDEARAATVRAYEQSWPLIMRQVGAMQATVALLREQGLITPLVYDEWQARLEAISIQATHVDDRIRAINQAAEQAFSSGFVRMFDDVAQSLAGVIEGTKSWGDLLGDVFRSGLQFAASFLKALADILIQMLAMWVLKQVLNSSSGGIGGMFFHGGGKVGGGSSRWSKNLPAAAFFAAPRLHGGGGLGLRSDEYTAILQRGEEVLDEDNPRHVNNAGQGGGQRPIIVQPKIINAIDAEDVITKAADTPGGQKAIINVIRANKDAVKTALA